MNSLAVHSNNCSQRWYTGLTDSSSIDSVVATESKGLSSDKKDITIQDDQR